ncbi:MAG: hypothetical protein OER85_08425 [Gammaproteobacteria bacterium]|nr:hypothetical protein [Gammaproteobacteria bacterium]
MASSTEISKTLSPAIAWLALLTGLLPFCIVNLAYLGSASAGHLPWCFPYLEGCTSISSAGRYGFSYFFFKAGMIPAALVMGAFWIVCRRWLLTLGDVNGRMVRAMVYLGCISAVFLMLYTVFLGSKGDVYNFMRRTGVIVYFSFGYLAQLILLGRLRGLQAAKRIAIPAYILNGKLAVLIALLMIGLGSIPISNFVVDKHRPENAVEWTYALLMVSYYFFTWLAIRHTAITALAAGKNLDRQT